MQQKQQLMDVVELQNIILVVIMVQHGYHQQGKLEQAIHLVD